MSADLQRARTSVELNIEQSAAGSSAPHSNLLPFRPGMSPGRLAAAIVLVWSAVCLALAAVVFVNLRRIDSPERYIALGLGLVMLYMGGSMLAGLIWPPKAKDPNAPIEIPPRDQVRGRTSYREDGALSGSVMLVVGAIFLAVSLGAARKQPVVLVFAVMAVGILAGAGVKIWRQIQYGHARLELDMPARRGDTLSGVIRTSGPGWAAADRDFDAVVELLAIRTYRRQSGSVVVAREFVDALGTRNGNDVTIRFTATIPVIDTSEGRFSWNVQLETHSPEHRATFLIDVA